MSESGGGAAAPSTGTYIAPAAAPAPAATPAAAPAPAAAPGESGPAPDTQPAISVTEAARLLGRQRRANGEARAAANSNGAAAPGAAPAAPAASPAAPSTLQAMEQALGLPAQPAASGTPGNDNAPGPVPANDIAGGVSIGGKYYTAAQLAEALSKADDYTHKTQTVAEQARALQQQQEALATVLPYIQPELARLAEQLQNAPPRPDPRLAQIDPARYLQERAVWEQAVEEQQRLGSLTQMQQQAQARAMEQAVAAGNEQLAREFPFWADPKTRLEAQQQIVQWATSEKGGFNRNELQSITSPAYLKALMKASMFDRMVDQARTSAPVGINGMVRGTAPPPAASERLQAAQAAFESKPDIRSAAALIGARRRDGAR